MKLKFLWFKFYKKKAPKFEKADCGHVGRNQYLSLSINSGPFSIHLQAPPEFKEVLDNTVVAALSHPSPLVSLLDVDFLSLTSYSRILYFPANRS